MNKETTNNIPDGGKFKTAKNQEQSVIYRKLDLSNVSPVLKVARKRCDLEKIWAFREQEYRLLLPDIRGFDCDPYDRFAAVLFTEDSAGNVTSTGRLVFDSPIGFPEENLVHFLIKEHRKKGRKLAEYGRVIIREDMQKGLIKHYFKSTYSVAADNGIDSIIVVSKQKDLGFYQKMVGANVLSYDVNETFGGEKPYACIEWKIPETNPRFLQWCGLARTTEQVI